MDGYTMLYFSADLNKEIMKIRIKTTLIEMEVEDHPTIGSNNYTKRTLPELPTSIKAIIDEAVRLHNEVSKSQPE